MSDGIVPELATTQTLQVTVAPPEQSRITQFEYKLSGWQFQVSGESGLSYKVEASTNLVDWVLLSDANIPTVPFRIIDPGPRLAARFYRISYY